MTAGTIALMLLSLQREQAISSSFTVDGQAYNASLRIVSTGIEAAILRQGQKGSGFMSQVRGLTSTLAPPEPRKIEVYQTGRRDQAAVVCTWYFESWHHTRIFIVNPVSVKCLFATTDRSSDAWRFQVNRRGRLREFSFADRWSAPPKGNAGSIGRGHAYILTTTFRQNSDGAWRRSSRGQYLPLRKVI